MYAIVEIAGQQFKAEEGRKLYVHRLPQPEGEAVSFSSVMLVERDGQVLVGAPMVQDATVEVEVLRHLKDDKVIVFKKKRRKGYRVKNGHRQCLTQVLIKSIKVGAAE
ncbi:MAG: 50S ribosomal protein L21 [Rikenellaceae bacterium]